MPSSTDSRLPACQSASHSLNSSNEAVCARFHRLPDPPARGVALRSARRVVRRVRQCAGLAAGGTGLVGASRRPCLCVGWRDGGRTLVTTRQGVRVADRLAVGVAYWLSRSLRVLTQPKSMRKERISSQEVSGYQHQRDPDPSRSLRFRQVRQVGRRLQRRQPARRDPQDPPHPGPAQHRGWSAPAGSAR